MSTTVNWQSNDFSRVATVINGATITVDTSNFQGVLDPNFTPSVVPQPVDDANDPTVFVTWNVEYEGDPEGFFDASTPPIRRGVVRCRSWTQVGGGMGHNHQIMEQLKTAFGGATADNVQFIPRLARVETSQILGSWWMDEILIPFFGVG